ncbi:hypothetical protein PsAD46_02655 [Pseudovibrio sp. Ad46]|nr:hypothetical protein PsAD46_02655 [Pseudovibrio sp. Ad46]KZK92253.1 hypothetical protein PsAD5_04008 [Pseudovibrio sp. Ad5]
MKYHAYEKLEIIRLVEASQQLIKYSLELLGTLRSTSYVWYSC